LRHSAEDNLELDCQSLTAAAVVAALSTVESLSTRGDRTNRAAAFTSMKLKSIPLSDDERTRHLLKSTVNALVAARPGALALTSPACDHFALGQVLSCLSAYTHLNKLVLEIDFGSGISEDSSIDDKVSKSSVRARRGTLCAQGS
jgi:hypothetical protein